MGKGKGDARGWCYMGYEGSIILQMGGVAPARLRGILHSISGRLPGKCYVICYGNRERWGEATGWGSG